MPEQNNIVGVLRLREIRVCEQALRDYWLVLQRAEQINANPNTAFMVEWRGGLEDAMRAAGFTSKPESREEDQRDE